MLPSTPPDTTALPSRLHATLRTESACSPLQMARPVAVSHTCTRPRGHKRPGGATSSVTGQSGITTCLPSPLRVEPVPTVPTAPSFTTLLSAPLATSHLI